MGQDLPVTSYALLGLLTFGDELTGYELKQRADRTLRFYWVSPAMSQVYSELTRLKERGLVLARTGGDTTTYRISARGRSALEEWMRESEPGFSVLKHPVALRLLFGHVVDPATTIAMLKAHVSALDAERAALLEVREGLRGADAPGQPFRHPSLVADWGLDYLDNERRIVTSLIERLQEEGDG
jgi:DNA-binding PadR family transcriptional regulator